MKKKFYDVKPEERRRMLKEFCGIIVEIKSRENAEKFLRDLLTPSEIIMIMHRIEIAKMLLAGFSYSEISKKLKVGFNTITGVNRWLFNGFGGYIDALKEAENQKQREAVIPMNEWEILKKKYPVHFYIFNLLSKYKNTK
jgi:TrpR-related protein YerC/YecD